MKMRSSELSNIFIEYIDILIFLDIIFVDRNNLCHLCLYAVVYICTVKDVLT